MLSEAAQTEALRLLTIGGRPREIGKRLGCDEQLISNLRDRTAGQPAPPGVASYAEHRAALVETLEALTTKIKVAKPGQLAALARAQRETMREIRLLDHDAGGKGEDSAEDIAAEGVAARLARIARARIAEPALPEADDVEKTGT